MPNGDLQPGVNLNGCDDHEGLRARAHWTIPRQYAVEQCLVNRVQDGDHEAFYELVRPHEGRVHAAAFVILRNEADAEDCAQEAFLKALKGIRQFRGEARFGVWLMQIAVNEARMRKRKGRNAKWKSMPHDFADWRETPSEALERKEIWERLAQALRSLGAKYSEVFVLREIDQLSIAATAKVLSISAGAVKTRLLRARLMLRDELTASWRPWEHSGPIQRKAETRMVQVPVPAAKLKTSL